MLTEAMQQELAWLFTISTAYLRAWARCSPTLPGKATEGPRSPRIRILMYFHGVKNQKEVVLRHYRLVLLPPVKQKQLLSVCRVPESLFCWESPGDPKQSPWTKVK